MDKSSQASATVAPITLHVASAFRIADSDSRDFELHSDTERATPCRVVTSCELRVEQPLPDDREISSLQDMRAFHGTIPSTRLSDVGMRVQIIEELRSGIRRRDQQPVTGAGAGDVEQLALALVNFIKVASIADLLDALLQRQHLVIAGDHRRGAKLETFRQVRLPTTRFQRKGWKPRNGAPTERPLESGGDSRPAAPAGAWVTSPARGASRRPSTSLFR